MIFDKVAEGTSGYVNGSYRYINDDYTTKTGAHLYI
jgi:hypothetical protein